MWFPLLVMAVAVSIEPIRIGMTVLMLNRPRPLLHLAVLLAGGFTMGIAVGVTVLFVLRPAVGSTHFTLPTVQITVGMVVLVIAAAVAVGVLEGRAGALASRTWQRLNGGSLWTAGAAGFGIALPSVDYLAALALIVAAGAAGASWATQIGALLAFNVVALALVEIPLISYLVAPDRTRVRMTALQDWLQSHRRRNVSVLLATVGCLLLGAGLIGI